jgi:hypothetical protein
MQVYLDEFVFRFNRRRMPMAAFQTLLGIGTRLAPTTYEEVKDPSLPAIPVRVRAARREVGAGRPDDPGRRS